MLLSFIPQPPTRIRCAGGTQQALLVLATLFLVILAVLLRLLFLRLLFRRCRCRMLLSFIPQPPTRIRCAGGTQQALLVLATLFLVILAVLLRLFLRLLFR